MILLIDFLLALLVSTNSASSNLQINRQLLKHWVDTHSDRFPLTIARLSHSVDHNKKGVMRGIDSVISQSNIEHRDGLPL